MTTVVEEHNKQILDQFTRQAVPFAAAPAISNEDSLRVLVHAVGVTAHDTVLDVACGPGLVACTLAAHAQQVTGIDLVPAMLEEAQKLQSKKGLQNVRWHLGEAADLPLRDCSFSLVVTRYSFHHLLDPKRALQEMARVCRPGGRVAVVDVMPEPEKAPAYDELERWRDPSHARVVSRQQLKAWGQEQQMQIRNETAYRLEMELESLLAASFPRAGNTDRIRQRIRCDIGIDRLGVNARWRERKIHVSLPISVLVWMKPDAENPSHVCMGGAGTG